eukprot:TRINITY_DN113917_c0_g1_i1.p1 TRINITY_DN113917_c0_g1~~TRINITY_DN113917_c0_g1_i1.p1  ORF type:complete len:569 (+),score=91.48 TRINITY_DN113917_c0_g1_i1:61-1707(+)
MSLEAQTPSCDDDVKGWNDYLVVFTHHNQYFNMRFQELESLAELQGVPRSHLYRDAPPGQLCDSPCVYIRLPDEASARGICERAVLIKAIIELWGAGKTYSDVLAQAQAIPSDRRRLFTGPPKSFLFRVEAFGRTLQQSQKLEAMQALHDIFEEDEKVDLQRPDTILWILEEHEHLRQERRRGEEKKDNELRMIFFGRQVAGARGVDKKTGAEPAFYQRYALSKRAVLGPTTMENELAFIMANIALARRGSVCFDPFCGTAGLLIAAGHFGALTVGGELDIRVVKGWRVAYTKNKQAAEEVALKRAASSVPDGNVGYGYASAQSTGSGTSPSSAIAEGSGATAATAPRSFDVVTNFYQYNLKTPEILCCDAAVPPWRSSSGWVDALVTDPPYGIRAGAKKQGRDGEIAAEDKLANYIPSKVEYKEDEVLRDLLDLAAQALRDDGRLVFLLPVDLMSLLGADSCNAKGSGASALDPDTLRDKMLPKNKKDGKASKTIISETTRDPLLLEEARYEPLLPSHPALEHVGASLQVLSGGLGRLLVTMKRRPR